jgi:hypothetical protein
LKLTTLNPERTRMLFRESIDAMANQAQRDKFTSNATKDTSETNGISSIISPDLLKSILNLQSPELIRESLLSSTWNLIFPKICVSSSPNWNHLEDCSLYWSGFEIEEENNLPYVIGYDLGAVIYVWLKVGATMEDELQSYVHALLLRKVLSGNDQVVESKKEGLDSSLLQRFVMKLRASFPYKKRLHVLFC